MKQSTFQFLGMVTIGKTSGDRNLVFRGGILAGLLWFFTILALSACVSATPEPPAVFPVEVVFETPMAEIDSGVRLAPAESQWDGYGEAIDVRGDVLVIGASEWNPCGPGSAYVYRFSDGEWQEEAQLTASDRDVFMRQAQRFEGQRFGSSVALGEGIIAIGAPGNEITVAGENTGAVYLYEYDGQTWVETAKFTPERPDEDTAQAGLEGFCGRMKSRSFGDLVALNGDTLAVGGDSGTNSAYVFHRGENGWQEEAQIPIPGMAGRELYMVSMALFGDSLAVSALTVLPQSEEVQPLTGNAVVYVFERSQGAWRESFQFAPEGEADILFFPEVNIGASVALAGDSGQAKLLAIGLPGFPDWSGVQDKIGMFGVNPEQVPDFPESRRQYGAVYLFERAEDGGWSQQATLKPAGWENPPGPGTLFPFWFGVPYTSDDEPGNSDETGYFASAGFPESVVFPGHIFSEDPEISFFGATVDLDGNQLAVTAGFANATYVFESQGQDWVYRFRIAPSSDGGMWEDYAQVVAISGDTLLLGTPGEFGNSAYVFRLSSDAER